MAPRDRQRVRKTGQNSSPPLGESTLSQLTNKIDEALAEKSDKQSRAGKRKRQDDDDKHTKPNKRQPLLESSKIKERLGKKRAKSMILLEEIKALGGDEEDLELVAGIDSDAEDGQGRPTERPLEDSFKSELAKFASSLGFEKARQEALDADSEDEEAQPEDAGSASEDSGSDAEVEEEAAPPSAPKASSAATKATGGSKEPSAPLEKSGERRWAGKLMFEPRPDWHALSQDALPAPSSDDVSAFDSAIANLKAYAKNILDEDATVYKSAVSSSSSHKFMTTIMSDGTLSDKVSALTLAVQESPLHNIRAIETLLNMAGKKSRGQALAALGALVDLLGNGVVLPSDRRLRPFHAQPGLLGSLQQKSVLSWRDGQVLPGKVTKAHLIMWAFEDWLKATYFKVLQLLELWSGDEIEYSRSRSLDFVFGLLRDKPEQEANLLRLLVSKLGDRDSKIASRASYLLLQLLNTHPGMKPIVIQTVEQELLLRPGQSLRTKYHAINTLNQTMLSSKEPSVANNLVRIYFELFLALLRTGSLGYFDHMGSKEQETKDGEKPNKKQRQSAEKASGNEQEVAQKLVTAVLTGVNRAIPFTMTDESTLEKHLDTLFRITHSSNFNTSIQALILIQQVAASKQISVDRFYRVLYESLLDPRLVTSSKQTLYLNLLYRSLKNDADVRRVKAFVKRMLQVVNLHQPSFTCGILYLVAELQATFPDLNTLLNDPEDNDDDGEEVFRDADQDGDMAEMPQAEPYKKSSSSYDGRKRNPEFSNAHRSCLWELVPYFSHYHPSVAVFANNLLVKQKSLPPPELANHTLIHFLDKFVYRNPKTSETQRGNSIMQPVLAADNSAHVMVGGKIASKQQPAVNSAAFWNKKPQDVAAEDVFFYEYFSQVGKPGQASRAAKREKKRADKADEEGEEDAEDEIWQALVDSQPEIQGDDDGDGDMGFSDEDSDLASLLNMSDDSGDEDFDSELGGDLDALEGAGSEDALERGVEFNDFTDSEAEIDGAAKTTKTATALDTAEKGNASRMRKKELKALPTFASADDYAEMLAQEDDGF